MSDAEGVQRPPALEEFMAELKRLRQQAGNPSFRKMAELSGAVSHATLHLTVTGRRLQPWETVREFVRACGGDEAEWRSRYRRTKAVLSGELPESADSAEPAAETAVETAVEITAELTAGTTAETDGFGSGVPATTVGSPDAADRDAADRDAADRDAADRDAADRDTASSESRGVSRRWVAVPLAVLAVVAVVAGLRLFGGDDGRAEAGAQRTAGGAVSSPAEVAALTEPVYEGDASTLSRDLGIPDGAVVAPKQQFTRTFELRNVGTVAWKGRYLQRMDNETGPRHNARPPAGSRSRTLLPARR